MVNVNDLPGVSTGVTGTTPPVRFTDNFFEENDFDALLKKMRKTTDENPGSRGAEREVQETTLDQIPQRMRSPSLPDVSTASVDRDV